MFFSNQETVPILYERPVSKFSDLRVCWSPVELTVEQTETGDTMDASGPIKVASLPAQSGMAPKS